MLLPLEYTIQNISYSEIQGKRKREACVPKYTQIKKYVKVRKKIEWNSSSLKGSKIHHRVGIYFRCQIDAHANAERKATITKSLGITFIAVFIIYSHNILTYRCDIAYCEKNDFRLIWMNSLVFKYLFLRTRRITS